MKFLVEIDNTQMKFLEEFIQDVKDAIEGFCDNCGYIEQVEFKNRKYQFKSR